MKRSTSRMLTAGWILALAITITGCEPSSVKVGVVVPLTGDHQSYGEANRRGIELAFEEITSNDYPITLELDVVDSTSNPTMAKELLEQQFENGAFVVIGGSVSPEAKEMVSGADRFDRVMISPSATSAGLTKASRNFFRLAPSDDTAGNKMADFAFRVLELKTVVVISEDQDYAQGVQRAFSAAFETQGGEVLEHIDVPPNTSDFEGLMDRVLTVAPQAVYLAGYESGIAAMIQELRRLNFKGRILTTHAFSSPSAIARVGQAAEGVVLTQTVFEPDSDFAHVQSFVRGYREKFGEEPDLFAAEGYDTMKVVAKALESHHTLATELHRGLWDEIKEFPGVTGSIQFNENGDVRKFPRVYIIGSDLLLYDYSKRLEENQRKLKEKQKELQRRLEEIRKNAAQMGG
ncbi:MAG: branched-chain amino acid ABC transporter substrate-binding protein [Acidobacteriota bacterium]